MEGIKNAFKEGHHALCWAHPFRKIRDLKDSKILNPTKKQHLKKVFAEFKTLYGKVRKINLQPFIRKEREQAVKDLSEDFDRFTHPHLQDPEKLKRIKSSLKEQKDCYFVCLLEPFVSPDNNKAERALRHLVIKRKKSFGCKTQKGADALSILYSVVMSLWKRSKQDFFRAYRQELKPLV